MTYKLPWSLGLVLWTGIPPLHCRYGIILALKRWVALAFFSGISEIGHPAPPISKSLVLLHYMGTS